MLDTSIASTSSAEPEISRGREGLGLALLLSLVSAAIFVGVLSAGVRQLISPNVSEWLGNQSLLPAFLDELVLFGAAHLLLHLVFGVAIWLLAIAAEFSFVRVRLPRKVWVILAFVTAFAWVVIWNVIAFPNSIVATSLCCEMIPLGAFEIFLSFLTSVFWLLLIALAIRFRGFGKHVRAWATRAVVYSCAVALFVVTVDWLRKDAAAFSAGKGTPPHVIVIGIDSLRTDFVGVAGAQSGMTPNIDAALQQGFVFADTITPLARTFPSWVSVLTGMSPLRSGARENLFSLPANIKEASVAHLFRHSDYRTVFATDEVRFSNIDETFGFDQVLTPRMGVTDFLLGSVNDTPLANLVANTWLGRVLFPDTYSNRAAAASYRPATFIELIEKGLGDPNEPIFLAAHLALPHWPYTWADRSDRVFSRLTETRYQYAAAVIEADRQFGELMQLLRRRGFLNNAVLVVLSDHGEGLGLRRDNLAHAPADGREKRGVAVSMWGHGNSVLSPYQYSVLLGLRVFGSASLPDRGTATILDVPATLEDVAPTLVGLINLTAKWIAPDGVDWTPEIREPGSLDESKKNRVRFTETGYIVGFAAEGSIDPKQVAAEAVKRYRINSETGRITFRQEMLDSLLGVKERAALFGGWTVSAVKQSGRTRYVAIHEPTQEVRELTQAPMESERELFKAWAALHEHFEDELASGDPDAGGLHE